MTDEKQKAPAIAWLVLVLGGVFQVGWAIGVDYTDGFTDPLWDAISIVTLFLSMVCMDWPMSHGVAFTTAYAVWLGIGVVLTILVSAALGLEEVSVGMAIFLAVTVAGVVGLKMTPVEYLPPKERGATFWFVE